MNTLPAMMQPARAPDGNGGKSQDNATAGPPFGQVLSNEIASQRNARAVRENSEAARQQENPEQTEASTTTDTAEAAAPVDPVSSAVTEGPLETLAPDAATLLALTPPPAALPPLPAGTAPADAVPPQEEAAADPATLAAALESDGRKGRSTTPALPHEARAPAVAPRDGGRAAADSVPLAVPGKSSPQVAPAAAQVAQAPTVAAPDGKVADTRFEQILHPALRAAAQALTTPAPLQHDAEIARPHLAPAVGSTAWGQALGDRVVWMAGAAQQTATLTLNPPNLGPLQVVLNLSNDQASASFFAAQPEVRQAIESAFPRLREMMNEAGIQLQQATVSADASPQQQQDRAPERPGHATRFGEAEPAQPALAASVPVRAGRGLIDTFA